MTLITEFILLGFPLSPRMQMLLFALFSLFYAFTLLGNGTIVGLICLDSRLHTPMYFFLSHLAIVDMAYACNTVPQTLINLLDETRPITFAVCMTQTFLFLAFAHTECVLLVVMSYDRYVAICHPLHYTVIMNWRVCTILAAVSWIFSFLLALVHLVLILRLPFCGPHEINHFFCEILSVLKLACADTTLNQVVIFAACVFILVAPLCFVLVSYTRILVAILRIQSGNPEDPVRGGTQKGLLHLFLPPLCGRALLWQCHCHVHGPQVPAPRGAAEGSFPVLQFFQPHAEPPNLQSEEC